MQTLDPHSQNEILTNTLNNHIYESLTRRDKDMRIVPALALEWAQSTWLLWKVKLAPASNSMTARPSPPRTWCSRWRACETPTPPTASTPTPSARRRPWTR